MRYLLRLFVGEWQTSFECHCWRWGNGNRWQNNPLNIFIARLGWEGASPALQLLEEPRQLQLTCRCWPLRGTHWPPAPSCFCQELAWNRDADGSSGMEAFSWRTPDQTQLSREWSEIIHAALQSDGCKIVSSTADVSSYSKVTMEQGSKQGFVCQSCFSSEVALLRQVCVKQNALLLFLHPHSFKALQLRLRKCCTLYK